MKKLFLITSLAIGLMACGPAPEPSKPNYQLVKITYLNPPKHFSVKYTVLSTGERRETRSKHCGSWSRVKVGNSYYANINETGCDFIRSIK